MTATRERKKRALFILRASDQDIWSIAIPIRSLTNRLDPIREDADELVRGQHRPDARPPNRERAIEGDLVARMRSTKSASLLTSTSPCVVA